ncbi:MAG: GNAT family N-acetyltransferase [Anaerolineales bacterium]|nr:GNAT family N-acetyltransferase [Anaerolineales bacterium]
MATITTAILAETRQLRPLNILHDLPAVADLVEACFAGTLDADGRRYLQQMRRAGKDNSFLRWATTMVETASMPLSGYVWEQDGQVVGNVSLIPHRQGSKRVYLIANVAVRPELRRRGIGRALTTVALEHARERHADEIWLHVRDDNPGAIALYEQLGFVAHHRRTTWLANPDRGVRLNDLGMTVGARQGRDWREQEHWLRRAYPDGTAWYQALPWLSLRPGLGPSLYRLFLDAEVRQWAVREDGHLLGTLSWQAIYGQSDRLWLAATVTGGERAVTALLLNARRQLSWRRSLTLDFPAGEYADPIRMAGFEARRTLVWMRIDETSAVARRTSI